MGLSLVTGYAGKAHVTSAQDGALNAATYGCEKYVFDIGNCFAAEILSNNCVRIKDGYGLNQGRFMGMDNGDYEDVVIDNGTKGMKRADLIVMRYSVDADTGIETAEMIAIKGEAGADYTDPDIVTGDILTGATKDDFLLYRVKVDDINLVAVESLFETSEATMKLVSEIQKKMPTLKNPEYETPEEPAELVSGENLGTALGKLAAAVKLLLTHKTQQATATILGHVKLSDSAAVTEKGVYALDAVEKNAAVNGTLANKVDALNSSLGNIGKSYHYETTVSATGSWAVVKSVSLPPGIYMIERKATNKDGKGVICGSSYDTGQYISALNTDTAIYTDIFSVQSQSDIGIFYLSEKDSNVDLSVTAVRLVG